MQFIKLKLLVIALLMFAASSAFASYSYDVTVDTSYLATQSGNLSFQFNPIMFDAPNATATISGFSITGGSLEVTPASTTTFASGNIYSGSATIGNTDGYNEYFHGVTFGNSFSFHVDLSGTIDAAASGGSLFSLSLYNAAGDTPLAVPNDPFGNGTVHAMNLNPNGSVTDVTPTPTPVPAAAWLLGSGLMGLVGLRRRKQ